MAVNGSPPAAPFRDLPVLVTGHTGFKGAWLSHWLLRLGARVTGFALPPATTPDLFTLLRLEDRLDHRIGDVRDREALRRTIADARPALVIHMAAQPLVRQSYAEPLATWDVNVGGTVNLLEAIRNADGVRACLIVTSDKCYDERGATEPFREDAPLGGHDPYASSKAAAEIAVSAWRRSFLAAADCRIATARAGNVIGGGDWSTDRIVADLARAVAAGAPLRLRNPHAVRPWQHVLDALSGYLLLATGLLSERGRDHAEAWNFGPDARSSVDVMSLASSLARHWGGCPIIADPRPGQPHESSRLVLDAGKSRQRLGWSCAWDLEASLRHTAGWYRAHADGADPLVLSDRQLDAHRAASLQAGTSHPGTG